MAHYIRCLFVIPVFIFTANLAYPQSNNCNADYLFEKYYRNAKSFLKEQKCVRLDVTASYDSAGTEPLLRWEMGDGSKAQGFAVNHCYDAYGVYQAVMHVFTKEGELVSENELVLDVVIKEEVEVSFSCPDTISMDSLFAPAWKVSELSSYTVNKILFDFGDGSYSCHSGYSHRYSYPGLFTVKMLLVLSAADGEFYLAAEKQVFVKGFNIHGQLISDFFNRINDSLHIPYLIEPIRMSIVGMKDYELMDFREIAPDGQYLQYLPLGKDAWLYIWKGNLLLRPQSIAAANDSIESFEKISNALREVLGAPPLVLNPVYFKLNETVPIAKYKRILKQNIQILQSLPLATVRVGSHSHTGGMRGSTEKYADARSEYLAGKIRKRIGNKLLINIDSPKDTESLINTCFDDPDCGRVNTYFNGRSDFKIISVGKI
jgi:hypothetical protein